MSLNYRYIMNKIFLTIIVLIELAIGTMLFVAPFFCEATQSFNGFWEGHPGLSLTLPMIALPIAGLFVSLAHDFFDEETTGRSLLKFIILIVSIIALMICYNYAKPSLEFIIKKENHLFGIVGYIAALIYILTIGILLLYPIMHIVGDGIFGFGGFFEKFASIIATLLMVTYCLPLAIFIISKFWWLFLVGIGILFLIGFASSGGGQPARRYSNDDMDVDVYVDEYGGKYVRTNTTAWDTKYFHRIDTSKSYKFKNGTFYKLRD